MILMRPYLMRLESLSLYAVFLIKSPVISFSALITRIHILSISDPSEFRVPLLVSTRALRLVINTIFPYGFIANANEPSSQRIISVRNPNRRPISVLKLKAIPRTQSSGRWMACKRRYISRRPS